MNPTQERPGYYWKTNDPADLPFNEAGPEKPETVRCYNMQDHLNQGEFRHVPVAGLEFLTFCQFGEARPSRLARIRWTGDSHDYGIYRNPSGLYKDGIVMLECHGGGMVGFTFDNLISGETWEHIAANFSSEMIWNLCNQVAHAYRAARDAERQIVYRAFAEGRLKKRRRHNKIYVELVAAQPNQTAA
ncbi:hypothetical protein [Granulicella sp. L60]|uniref:hypothetical protein n=1 Tax=Granulicella sp. L60 TaxID=1641866 RepID=UPI00131A9754|nr:hypothetical protein [Granulicella sp. L60]